MKLLEKIKKESSWLIVCSIVFILQGLNITLNPKKIGAFEMLFIGLTFIVIGLTYGKSAWDKYKTTKNENKK